MPRAKGKLERKDAGVEGGVCVLNFKLVQSNWTRRFHFYWLIEE